MLVGNLNGDFTGIALGQQVAADARSCDCGFSSQATYNPEVHPKIMWAKFEALTEGARLATHEMSPLAAFRRTPLLNPLAP